MGTGRVCGIGERHRETGSEAAVIQTGRTEVGVRGNGGHIVHPPPGDHRQCHRDASQAAPGVLASR